MNAKEAAVRHFAATVESFAPGITWQVKKAAFSNPYLDLEIGAPAAALLVFDGKEWRFEARVPNAQNDSTLVGYAYEPPRTILERVMTAIIGIAQGATARGDALTAFSFEGLLVSIARADDWKEWRIVGIGYALPSVRTGLMNWILPVWMDGISRSDIRNPDLLEVFDEIEAVRSGA